MYQYGHGGNGRFQKENVLDFSANINPVGLPEGVEEAISKAIADCVYYPDYESRELREKISEFDHVPTDNIFCANGASDIIFRLVYSLKPKKALVLAPSFLDYSRALTSYGCEIYYHMLYEKNEFSITEDILHKIKEHKFQLIFICNPNNPTGVLTKKELLISIIKEGRKTDTFIVVDECFLDFIWEAEDFTVKKFTEKYNNLIVLKAFTKIFALPGIRLGYAICGNKDLLEQLYFCGADWGVSALAQAAGIAALNNPEQYIEESRTMIVAEKDKIIKKLQEMKFEILGSMASYIFFKSPYSYDIAKELYHNYNVSIRSCDNYIGLDKGFYRVGIGKKYDNNRLTDCLKKMIEDKL